MDLKQYESYVHAAAIGSVTRAGDGTLQPQCRGGSDSLSSAGPSGGDMAGTR